MMRASYPAFGAMNATHGRFNALHNGPRPWASGRRKLRRSTAIAAQANGGAQLRVFSPSKINLFLRVMRRREDGYHDLASLFHVIDLGDWMEFEALPLSAGSDALQCSDASIPTDERNLVIKALKLFRANTGVNTRFHVSLDKRVPHGAGLGGGSGNAATTLWAANELCGRPATDAQLLEWAGDIGSDISVFFSQGAAYCTGRGEVVEGVVPPLPLDTPLLLVKPPVGLSTPAIFKALNLDARSTADPLALLDSLARTRAMSQDLAVNDLEQPAFDNLPSLAALKARLQQDPAFSAVFMTGSGSTLVCVGSDTVPAFLTAANDPEVANLFVSPARFIVRQPGAWYTPSSSGTSTAAAAAAASSPTPSTVGA